MAAPGARIVLMGHAAGAPLGPLPAGRLYAGNVSIGGFSISSLARSSPHRVGAAIREAMRLLDDEAIAVRPQSHRGLSVVPSIHDRLARRASTGKNVVLV